jgi:flavin-dependent dehydrogenase
VAAGTGGRLEGGNLGHGPDLEPRSGGLGGRLEARQLGALVAGPHVLGAGVGRSHTQQGGARAATRQALATLWIDRRPRSQGAGGADGAGEGFAGVGALGTGPEGPTGRGAARPVLGQGARVGVVGGGPAGSFFTYFFLEFAKTAGLEVAVDVYEPRDFRQRGPAGCNHCGGIVSESLVQMLATEGVKLPEGVVQYGIDSYVLHSDVGAVRIETPLHEKRIAAVYRGNGPRESEFLEGRSFDGHLLDRASAEGATVIRRLVADLRRCGQRPQVVCPDGFERTYDLLVLAGGVNSNLLGAVERLGFEFGRPTETKTFITEFRLGRERVEDMLGTSMHIFLLDLPHLEFGALIPKGDFVTACLLGRRVDDEVIRSFLTAPEVRACFPGGMLPPVSCHCFPRINVGSSVAPFADRVVLIGDCATTRLYKDGIGSAYRTAKAAASTAVFHGVSAEAFRRHYGPTCRGIERDNTIGKLLFGVGHLAQHARIARRAMLRMAAREQRRPDGPRRLSEILWDLFSGSAPYREVLGHAAHPAFLAGLAWNAAVGAWADQVGARGRGRSTNGGLGRVYADGEVVIRQGDEGSCMYVIQEGSVEVLKEDDGREITLGVLREGDVFGDMAIFEREVRSASVRALGEARILTIDRQTFLRRLQEDPTIAYTILRSMGRRVRRLDAQVLELRGRLAEVGGAEAARCAEREETSA